MIDFPSNPTVGQVFNSLTGPLYMWDGTTWIVTGSQTKTASRRNRIKNPTAQVSQQNGSAALTASDYAADQWATYFGGIVASCKREDAITSPEGSHTGVSMMATTAKGTLAATDYMQFVLPIEGLDISDLLWGTAAAKNIVVRFNAFCEQAGTFAFALKNAAGDRVYVGSFTVAASVWQTFALAIPGDTTGTWPTDNTGITFRFAYAAGTTYTAPAMGWQAGNFFSGPGMTNGAAVANKKLIITDVGFYADPDKTGTPPAFEAPDYGRDLIDCMRYYEIQPMVLIKGGGASNPTQRNWGVQKRSTPTLSCTPAGGGSGAAWVATGNGGWFQSTSHSIETQGNMIGNARMI
jgi:hypothetical protein